MLLWKLDVSKNTPFYCENLSSMWSLALLKSYGSLDDLGQADYLLNIYIYCKSSAQPSVKCVWYWVSICFNEEVFFIVYIHLTNQRFIWVVFMWSYLFQYCQLRHLSSLCSHFHSNKENYSAVSEHKVIRIIHIMYSDILGWRKFGYVNVNNCKALHTEH